MKNLELFPHMLNQMFSELNAASEIVISYTTLSTGNNGLENDSPRLTGVNGCNSVTAFTDYLLNIKADLLERLSDDLPDLDIQARRVFIDQFIMRCRTYASVTSPLETDDLPGINSEGHQIRWGFHKPTFDPGDGPRPEASTQKILLRLTSRYASVWRLIGDALLDELHWLHCHATFLPVLDLPPDLKPDHEKITVRCSVMILGGLARLFYEINAFAIGNKKQFCEMLPDLFSTVRQKDISPRSLKNHFDTVPPKIMDLIREILRQMLEASQAFYNIK